MFEPSQQQRQPQQAKARFELTRIAEFEQYRLPINITGDYMFCFMNRYQSHFVSVTFDYDMFDGDGEDEDGDTATRTELEKDVMKLYERMTDKFIDLVGIFFYFYSLIYNIPLCIFSWIKYNSRVQYFKFQTYIV